MTEAESNREPGFPASRGTEISARDVREEEELLEQILGSLDERRARFGADVDAEVKAAIERFGIDWGHPRYRGQYDDAGRADLLRVALADPEARAVVEGYVAHLQEHRAEFIAKVLHPDNGSQ